MKTIVVVSLVELDKDAVEEGVFLPKGLLTYVNHTYLYHIYDFYQEVVDNFIVICRPESKDLVTHYIDLFDLPISVIVDVEATTDLETHKSLPLTTGTTRWILHPSEVIPLSYSISGKKNTITIISKEALGTNCLPVKHNLDSEIYIFNEVSGTLNYADNASLFDVVVKSKLPYNIVSGGLLDLSDLESRELLKESVSKTRIDVRVQNANTFVVKEALTREASHRLEEEVDLLKEGRIRYVNLVDIGYSNYETQKLLGHHPEKLSEINYEPLNVKNDVDIAELKKVFLDRTIERLNIIKDYDPFSISEIYSKLYQLLLFVLSHYKESADLHGNLLKDNILLVNSKPFYYSPSLIFRPNNRGPFEYDTSRFLFSINGFHDFKYSVDSFKDYRRYDLNKGMTLLEEAWVVVHWFNAAYELSYCPVKSIVALRLGRIKLDRIVNKIN